MSKNITIEKAVKSMVPPGMTYARLLEHAINALNMAAIATPRDSISPEDLLRMRILQDMPERGLEIAASLLAVVMQHARLTTRKG